LCIAILGAASQEVYESLIKLVKYELKSKKKGISYKSDLKAAFESKTKKPISVILKRSRRAFFILRRCKEDAWKVCNIAPTYWDEITEDSWNQLLSF
jgi:hypothetical protein